MKTVDIPTVTRENPRGKTFCKDLFIYHGSWHNEDGNINYRLGSLCICIVEQGTHSSTLNSKKCVVHKGEVLVCHPNDFYSDIKFSQDFYATFIYANIDLISSYLPSLQIREVLMKLKANPVLKLQPQEQSVLHSFLNVLRLKHDGDSATPVILVTKALLIEIFALINREPRQQIDNLSQPSILYQRFLDLLISLPVKPHSTAYYASELSVTPKYLSHVCKTQSDKTAAEWIREYIMNDAHRYLIASELSVKEIAGRLGFTNFSFFCQSVKRFWGASPLQIRNSR